jgi:RNA ligase (TIGR02306 family)
MAELKTEVVKIDSIENHPNADRMELAMIGGYQVCVQYGAFVAGDLAIYIPVDSILNEELESLIFGPDSKVKLHKHRVRAIKLRGAVSQGMLIPRELAAQYPGCSTMDYAGLIKVGMDVTKALGITKYQPPVRHIAQGLSGKNAPKRHHHPDFKKYTSINQFRKYWDAFEDIEAVYVTEKLHGTNFRCGWVPFRPRTFWQKVKNIFGLNKSWEFVYGSHNVQLMDGKGKEAFADNVYKRIVETHGLYNKIDYGEIWYGEIVGPGIQKNYDYGLEDVDVYFMDIMKDGEYIDFDRVIMITEALDEKAVPWKRMDFDRALIVTWLNHEDATSDVDGKTQPIEGFVIRPVDEQKFYGGRLILKLLSDAYLLDKGNTDYH